MPYFFHFRSDGNPKKPDQNRVLVMPLTCAQCTYTKDNIQCKRKACIGGPLCFQHLQIVHHLRVRPSTIPNSGKGVFAYDPSKGPNELIFKPNQRICDYYGEVITIRELNRRYGDRTAPYGIVIPDNFDLKEATESDEDRKLIEDGAIIRGIGTLVNHYPDEKNAKLRPKRGNTGVFLKAIRKIYNNQELFVSYGRSYRMNQKGVQYMTSTRKRPLEKLPPKTGGGILPNRFLQSLKKPRLSLFNTSRRSRESGV